MTKFLLITLAVLLGIILILVLAIVIQNKIYSKKIEDIEKKTQEEKSAVNKIISEILSDAENKKDTLHSDSISSFNASLNLLQNLAKSGKRNAGSN